MLVERMLPAALADGANENLLAWMHMRIAVIGLVRIFGRIVSVHVVGHRTAVNQEISGMVRLGRHNEYARRIGNHTTIFCGDLSQRLPVDVCVHLRPLEQVFAVVAGFGVVVCSRREPEVTFSPMRFRGSVRSSEAQSRHRPRAARSAGGRNARRECNYCSAQAHLHLQIALRSAVIGWIPRRYGYKREAY